MTTTNTIPSIDTQSMREIEANVKVDILRANTGIDITKIHCRKTGQPIATMNLDEVERILNFYTATRLEDVVNQLDFTSGVSMIWKHTNPDQLTKLQNLDPRGFFCYCINIALRNHHMHFVRNRKEWKSVEAERKFQNSLVKTWYNTANLTNEELTEANKVLRFFMLLDLHNKSHYILPWHLMFSTLNNKFERVLFANHSNEISASIAYNPDVRPLLPEEFATKHGIEFIKFCVKGFLDLMKVKMDVDLYRYKDLHVASAFRRTRGNLIAEIDVNVTDIGGGFHAYTLEEVIARSKVVRDKLKKQTQATTLNMDEDFTLDLNLSIDADGNTTLAEETKPAQIEMQVTKAIKLDGLFFGKKE